MLAQPSSRILFLECYSLICTDQFYFANDNVYVCVMFCTFQSFHVYFCYASAFVICTMNKELLTYLIIKPLSLINQGSREISLASDRFAVRVAAKIMPMLSSR